MFVSHRKRSNRFIIMIIQRVGLRFLLLLRSKSFIANTFERFSCTYCLAASKWFCIVYSNHWSIKSIVFRGSRHWINWKYFELFWAIEKDFGHVLQINMYPFLISFYFNYVWTYLRISKYPTWNEHLFAIVLTEYAQYNQKWYVKSIWIKNEKILI